jgi:hypothetical protein
LGTLCSLFEVGGCTVCRSLKELVSRACPGPAEDTALRET